MLIVVGIIHLLPVVGVFSSERVERLYGVTVTNPNLEILLRHRAVLFGLLGVFLIYAAMQPALRSLALIAAAISVLSFLALAWLTPGYNALVGRVVTADIVALFCLAAAAAAHFSSRAG